MSESPLQLASDRDSVKSPAPVLRRWRKVELCKPGTRPTCDTWRLQVDRNVEEDVLAALRGHSVYVSADLAAG